MTDRLVEQGYNVIPVNNGSAPSDTDTFRDLKAEIFWQLRQGFIDGEIMIYDIGRIIADLSAVKYDFMSNGKIFIKSKKDMKKEGGHSPDFADALALAWYGAKMVDGGSPIIEKKVEEKSDDTIVGNIFAKKF